MYKQESIQIESNQDGLLLALDLFLPQEQMRGIVQISHGMSEHRKRYYPFLSFLAKHGFVAVIHDHRGHGESIQDEEDLGYFGENGAEDIVKDVHQITAYLKTRFPNLPIYIIGHSMGSLIARVYLKKYDKEIDGMVLCGAPCNQRSINSQIFACRRLKEKQGQHYRSEKLHKLIFKHYLDAFPDHVSDMDWLCSDESVVANYIEDPLCGFTFTLNGFQSLFWLMEETYSKKGWMKKKMDLPILFLAGNMDPVIGNEKKWKQEQLFLKKIGYNNIQSFLFDGMRHEILNEVKKELVYEKILKFLVELSPNIVQVEKTEETKKSQLKEMIEKIESRPIIEEVEEIDLPEPPRRVASKKTSEDAEIIFLFDEEK